MKNEDVGAGERIWALVPVKRFAAGKSRLDVALGTERRAALARTLCEHVLTVLAGARGLAGVVVTTDGADVAELARSRGAVALADEAVGPLGRVVDAALPHLAARHATAVLVLMSDLPDLSTDDVEALVARLPGHDLVLAPDERDEGTNALLVRLPTAGTCFGHRDSFARHLRDAASRGLRVAVHRSPGLAFDVDEPTALERLGEPSLTPPAAAIAAAGSRPRS